MSIADAAEAAIQFWSREDAVTAVAIAGAETGGRWNNDARGDPASAYPDDPLYAYYACEGYTSFGPWQINTRWHYDKLQAVTGSFLPCNWRDYLFDPYRNASIAHWLWEESGWQPWTTYRLNLHRAYLAQAQAAVDAAIGPPPQPGGEPPLTPIEPPGASVEPPAAVAPP
jgi:hypothetical protein